MLSARWAGTVSGDGATKDRANNELLLAQLGDVPAGNRVLELTLAGYRPWSGMVAVEEGRARDVLVTMRRLPAQEAGHARIETSPPGAAITIDGLVAPASPKKR